MKKLIAISVVFALVAGVAFAADIGAEVIGMTDVIKGSTKESYYSDGSKKPSAVEAGGWPGGLKRVRVNAAGEDDSGTFGGWFRLEQYGFGGAPNTYGYAWWKPIDVLKFRLGGNPDGDFGADGVARWGFYQVGGDVGIPKENWRFGDSFYGGWGANGGLLTLTPNESLGINIGIPFSSGGKAQYVFMSSALQIAYTADGIGKFALTYQGGKGNVEEVVDKTPAGEKKDYINDPGKLWLYAGLTMIENLSIDIGFGYKLPASGDAVKVTLPFDDDGNGKYDDEVEFKGSYNEPIAIGLAAHYNGGDFGVKARTQVELAGEIAPDGGTAYNLPMNIIFDVLPYYNISDSLTFMFSAGVDYTAKSSNDGDKDFSYAKVGFHVTPYITIKSSWWAPNLPCYSLYQR